MSDYERIEFMRSQQDQLYLTKLKMQIESKDAQIKIMKKALEFCLPYAERMVSAHVPKGLPAIYYHTLSYEGDVKLAEILEAHKHALKQIEEMNR